MVASTRQGPRVEDGTAATAGRGSLGLAHEPLVRTSSASSEQARERATAGRTCSGAVGPASSDGDALRHGSRRGGRRWGSAKASARVRSRVSVVEGFGMKRVMPAAGSGCGCGDVSTWSRTDRDCGRSRLAEATLLRRRPSPTCVGSVHAPSLVLAAHVYLGCWDSE